MSNHNQYKILREDDVLSFFEEGDEGKQYVQAPPDAQPGPPPHLAAQPGPPPHLAAQPGPPPWQGENLDKRAQRVEDGQGRVRLLIPPLPGMAQQDADHHVKMVQDRSRYVVAMAPHMTRRDEPLDTREIFIHFWKKQNKDPHRFRLAHFGFDQSHKPVTFGEWSTSLIWVCAPDPVTGDARFYTHVSKERFHHTSFVGGGSVIGAGQWIVRKGVLRAVTGNTGHYRTPMDAFYRAVLHMAPAFYPPEIRNLDAHGPKRDKPPELLDKLPEQKAWVFLYDSSDHRWKYYAIEDFIRRPTLRGRLKVHPEAMFVRMAE